MTTDPFQLLRDRYGEKVTPDNFLWNDRLAEILSHRSIRSYLPNPLPPGTLESLIAAAQSASTSSNLQTWSVVAVEDPARKERLAQVARNQAHIHQCPLFLIWLADLARLTQIAKSRGQTYEGLHYLEMFLMAVIDAALAAQNAAIAAESFGLGTVYIGAIRNNPEAVATELNLPPHIFPVFGMCIGYPNPDNIPAVKPRLSQAAILHREAYSLEQQEEEIEQYDRLMTEFYQQQQMAVVGDWSQHSVERIATAASLGGRDCLREVLQLLGFQLR